ncbi:MAG: GNAT family N-acetyltransferase [Chloroflexi bacterium]|nr:MAG: GNAT family N-acetyltransferase [Chloroflexota bacterium]
MPEITPLRSDQAAEARRVIYTVAHELFHDEDTLEKTITRYETTWPLKDIADFQHSYLENGGTFLVMCEGERIIGTGALKRLEDGVAEIKRLWLLPEYQGRGLGYQMMLRLLDFARLNGYAKARLETSPKYQPRAFAFYQKMGFVEIPRYGDDPDDVGMELDL